jgi:DNA invertase Pin-like site-specific DNA recombinase
MESTFDVAERFSRLSDADWRQLRTELEARQIRVVALDLPTSRQLAAPGDEFTARMFAALNAMMLDMLAGRP